MAQGGGNKARLERAKAATDALIKEYQDEKIPSPRDIYRMGTEEFAMSVTQKAMIKALEALGLDQDLWLAILHETWAECMIELRESYRKAKSEHIRAELTKGIKGPIIRPEV